MTAYRCRYYFTDQGPLLVRSAGKLTAAQARRYIQKAGYTGETPCRFLDHVGHGSRHTVTVD